MDLGGFLMKTHDILRRTGNMDEQSYYDSGETEKCSRKLSENKREHPEESTGVFDGPVV